MIRNKFSEFEIYNSLYKDISDYAIPHQPKIDYVKNWVGTEKCSVLDAGCGRGDYLREIQKMGNDVFGVELSKICCEKYLTDIPHECNNLYDFSLKSVFYDKVYCTDVLEHIPPSDLEELLQRLSKISNNFSFLVASGSDPWNDIELHLSNFTFEEWFSILEKNFQIVKSIKGFHTWPYIHIFELVTKK